MVGYSDGGHCVLRYGVSKSLQMAMACACAALLEQEDEGKRQVQAAAVRANSSLVSDKCQSTDKCHSKTPFSDPLNTKTVQILLFG